MSERDIQLLEEWRAILALRWRVQTPAVDAWFDDELFERMVLRVDVLSVWGPLNNAGAGV